jgi:hypothetical protein
MAGSGQRQHDHLEFIVEKSRLFARRKSYDSQSRVFPSGWNPVLLPLDHRPELPCPLANGAGKNSWISLDAVHDVRRFGNGSDNVTIRRKK